MSKLNILDNFTPSEQARILRASSKLFLPSPTIDEPDDERTQEMARRVVVEIRKQLKVTEAKLTVNARSKILELLSEEISHLVMAGVNVASIKSRLADKGVLHPSKYEVVFEGRGGTLASLGIRPNHLIDAVYHPDTLVNLVSKQSKMVLTISAKKIDTKRIEDQFVLLVFSHRTGQRQEVFAGFRVYFDDVDLRSAFGASQVLECFIKRYGVLFQVGDQPGTAVLMDQLISTTSNRFEDFFRNGITVKENKDLLFPFMSGDITGLRSPDGGWLAEVLLGFVLNLTEYIATLRKHRVEISDEMLKRERQAAYLDSRFQ